MFFSADTLRIDVVAEVQPAAPRKGLLCLDRDDIAPAIVRVRTPPPREPHIAEREELDAALLAGTPDALHLFIERHPDGRYASEARQALDTLLKRTEKP